MDGMPFDPTGTPSIGLDLSTLDTDATVRHPRKYYPVLYGNNGLPQRTPACMRVILDAGGRLI